MINGIIDTLSRFALEAIEALPTVEPLNVPDDVYSGIDNIFGFVGWLMPYDIYLPLITFILSLTAFRIAYAVYLHFKR